MSVGFVLWACGAQYRIGQQCYHLKIISKGQMIKSAIPYPSSADTWKMSIVYRAKNHRPM